MENKKKEDRRIRRTRRLLQDAIVQLLRKKPLSKIQIKEIVEVADVSRPTFYKHFDTKEALLFSMVDDLFEKIGSEVFEESVAGDAVDLRQLLISSFEHWLNHSEALKWVLQIENKDLLINALQNHVIGIKRKVDAYFQPAQSLLAYEEFVVSYVSGGLYMLIKHWIDNDLRESAETMGTITFMLLTNGFTPGGVVASAKGVTL